MDIAQIEELIKVLQSSKTEELSVRCGDATVRIKKGRAPAGAPLPVRKAPRPAERAQPPKEQGPKDALVLAPMVGIFHMIDGISKVGSEVSEGQVVGAIESMKLLNDVVCEVTGRVVEVMVEDGTPVEYGQPLCRVELE